MSSGPSLGEVAATLAAFAAGTEALGVGAVIPQGPDAEAAVIRFDPAEEVLTVAEGEEIRSVPALGSPAGRDLAQLHLHRFPEFEVDLEEGTITGAVGALEELARNVSDLAAAFGDGALASAEFRTAGGAEPLEIGSDGVGGFVVSCGEVEFEVPPDWPGS